MRRPIVNCGAALIAATALVSGCTVDGSPSANPAPPPTTTTTTTTTTEPSSPIVEPPTDSTIPDVPPPPDAQTITCRDYQTRDEPTQVAIVKANGVTKNPVLVATLVGIVCLQRADQTVNFVISNMDDEIIHN